MTPLGLAVTLAVLIVGLDLLARRLRTPRPIVLAAGGVGIGLLAHLIPGFPQFTLAPQLVLVIVLPPLLAIPAQTASGAPFAGRQDVVILALAVVIATLLGQGLTLAPLIRYFGVADPQAPAAEREAVRRRWNDGRLNEDAALRLEAELDLAEMSARGIAGRLLGS